MPDNDVVTGLQEKIEAILGRPVEVIQLPNGKWIVEAFNWNNRNNAPLGDTKMEALEKFLGVAK